MKKVFKKVGNFLFENKRNIGIVLYFGARLIFPDYVKDNPEVLYITDALLGTGLAHNIYKNGKLQKQDGKRN